MPSVSFNLLLAHTIRLIINIIFKVTLFTLCERISWVVPLLLYTNLLYQLYLWIYLYIHAHTRFCVCVCVYMYIPPLQIFWLRIIRYYNLTTETHLTKEFTWITLHQSTRVYNSLIKEKKKESLLSFREPKKKKKGCLYQPIILPCLSTLLAKLPVINSIWKEI